MSYFKSAVLILCGLPAATMLAQPPAECEAHGGYYFVMRDRTDSVESQVLVKSGEQGHKCAYQRAPGDFEIERVNRNHFVKVEGRYAFFAGGTGPFGGELDVYDLVARKKVYEHDFMSDPKIAGGVVSFTVSAGQPERSKCPQNYDRIMKLGTGIALVQGVSFRVAELDHPENLKLVPTSKPRCVESQ